MNNYSHTNFIIFVFGIFFHADAFFCCSTVYWCLFFSLLLLFCYSSYCLLLQSSDFSTTKCHATTSFLFSHCYYLLSILKSPKKTACMKYTITFKHVNRWQNIFIFQAAFVCLRFSHIKLFYRHNLLGLAVRGIQRHLNSMLCLFICCCCWNKHIIAKQNDSK